MRMPPLPASNVLPTHPPESTARHGRAPVVLLALIFVIIFASRVVRFNSLNLETDEVWSVWQTLGTLSDTIRWTPYDWPPVYYVTVFGWQQLTGINPFTLRVMTAFTMLICGALLYRLAHKLYGREAALFALLSFSAFGYVLFLSTILRGYLLSATLWLAALLLTITYFERRSRWLGILIGLTLTALFYIHSSAIFGIVFLPVYSLVIYLRGLRRNFGTWLRLWILPGLITTALCLPEVLAKLPVITMKHKQVALYIPYVPPGIVLFNHYVDYAGQEVILWASLLLIASALLIERFGLSRRIIVLLLWMAAPSAIIWFALNIEAFHPRHLAWVMFGFALWIGWGLSLLPRAAKAALIVVMLVSMFGYIPLAERYETIPRAPLVTTFNALRPLLRGGDVVLLDPKCDGCANVGPEEWDYFSRAYFSEGLTFIGTPQTERRIWYVAAEGHEDLVTLAKLEKTRALSETLGDPTLRFRLYEAPPDPTGVLFANGMRLDGYELLNPGGQTLAWHDGEAVTLRLWWSVDAPVLLDYSEGTYILDPQNGSVTAQVDGPPQPLVGPSQTSRWQPGHYYLEQRTITLPYPLDMSEQTIRLSLYYWQDAKRITAPNMDSNTLLPLKTIFVKAIRGTNLLP